MSAHRRSPADRVRDRLARSMPAEALRSLPRGYQRLGRVLVLRLPDSLAPYYPEIGAAWRESLGVATVLRHTGRTDGEWRRPSIERIAGESTETEVLENGVRFGFDAAAIMFAAGNKSERIRVAEKVAPGERVVDLFAGIGYFALPIAVHAEPARVDAVEMNPTAYRYLVLNAERNGVSDRLRPILGDNRAVGLPSRSADRILLGYLPTAVPWIPRAVELAAPEATLHVHYVRNVRDPDGAAADAIRRAVETSGAAVRSVATHVVKPYGPGRIHEVADVFLADAGPSAESRSAGRVPPAGSR